MEVARAATAIPSETWLLDMASKAGVTHVKLVCSLLGGYVEDDGRERWSCVVQMGVRSGVARGRDRMEALEKALRNLDVIS